MTAARTQCPECPWRNGAKDVPADVQEHAQTNPDGFVCHTRCGPCPGPRLAGFGSITVEAIDIEIGDEIIDGPTPGRVSGWYKDGNGRPMIEIGNRWVRHHRNEKLTVMRSPT